jgi:hypothetical protein
VGSTPIASLCGGGETVDAADFEMKIYGPYTRRDGRMVCICYENGKRQTISYPRLVVELSLGRKLKDSGTHGIKYPAVIYCRCVWCKKIFEHIEGNFYRECSQIRRTLAYGNAEPSPLGKV